MRRTVVGGKVEVNIFGCSWVDYFTEKLGQAQVENK
jgi:hypothetical protein